VWTQVFGDVFGWFVCLIFKGQVFFYDIRDLFARLGVFFNDGNYFFLRLNVMGRKEAWLVSVATPERW